MLTLENIALTMKKEGKEVPVLHNINLEFARGKMYALTGPNGGGKTSLARVIMGIYIPTRGRIMLEGEDITSLTVTERARKGLGYAFQYPPRFKGLRVGDLLELAMRNDHPSERLALRRLGLCPEDYLEREMDSSLSGGEMKRIEIATVIAQNPAVRIFDEPEAGIDLWSFDRLIQVLKETHSPDRITVIISHQEKILSMVDEIILIGGGTVQMRGGREKILPQLKEDIACPCRESCRREVEEYADFPR